MTLTQQHSKTPSRGSWRSLFSKPEFITLALIVMFCVLVSVLSPQFFTVKTLFDTLRSSVTLGIFALGVLLVLAAGGIDVSFTAIAAFALYSTTKLTTAVWPGAPFLVMVAVSLVIGTVLGLFNGAFVYRFKVPSLIVTIGTQYLYRGFLLAFIGTAHIMNVPGGMDDFARVNLTRFQTPDGINVSLPITFLFLVGAALLTQYILKNTLLGRSIFAVGGSVLIAERLGIRVGAVTLFVFGYAGLLAGLGGILHATQNRLANPFDLVGSELDVIAAVVWWRSSDRRARHGAGYPAGSGLNCAHQQ